MQGRLGIEQPPPKKIKKKVGNPVFLFFFPSGLWELVFARWEKNPIKNFYVVFF